MSNLLTDIISSIGEDTIKSIGKKVGFSNEVTKTLSNDGLGVMLGGLTKNTQNKKETEKIIKILKKDHLNNLNNKEDIISGKINKKGDKIIEHILKGNKKQILENLAKENRVSKKEIENFLKILTPLFMGGLAKTVNETNMNSNIFSKVLTMATESDLNKKDQKLSGLLSLLDLDKDGKVIDDLPKIWTSAMSILAFLGLKKNK